MQKNILIVGGAGYVGSVMVYRFLRQGYRVRVFDKLLHGGESLLAAREYPEFEFIQGDVNDAAAIGKACDGIDSLVHLAAIVGEPACNRDKDLAWRTNYDGSMTTLEAARKANVRCFVFASTCSNYGIRQGDDFADETAPLNPISVYAESKVKSEREILACTDGTLVPTVLRLSTAHGLSPRMRFDLLVNDFIREALFKKKLLVYGPHFWRPYVHTEDIAQAAQLVFNADPDKVRGQVFNVGADDENYRKGEVVKLVCEAVPETEVETVNVESDPRSYRVTFKKVTEVLGYQTSVSVPASITQMQAQLTIGTFKEPFAPGYIN